MMLKKELDILLTAVMFYTRIPVPKTLGYSGDMLNKATRYFPLIGLIVGGLGAAVFMAMNAVLDQPISVVFTLILMVMLTGAFHEDALADFCDGFGGGYTKEKILSIMKDSCIGTYGAVGIVLLFLAKYTLLTSIGANNVPIMLVSAHVLSRFVAVCLIISSTYVTNLDNSKSKPIAEKISSRTFIIACIIGLSPLLLFNYLIVLAVIGIQALLFWYFRFYIHKKIGGYTGDVLGMLQQLSEVTFYITFLISASIQW